MTVCIAALAESGRSIVCMADRALSYGELIQWDSDSSKMFALRNGGVVIMFSGDEETTSRVLGKVIARENELGDDVAATRAILEEEYREAIEEIIEAKFLAPRLLTRDDYIKAISLTSINSFIESIAKEVKSHEPGCSLLVCGFDKSDRAFILHLDSPGVVTDMTITGFHSIGSGWEKSISKLQFSEFSRKDPLHVVLYDMFDAKAFAEMAVGVGFDWETRIITAHESGVEVPDRIDSLIEKGWAEHEHHPFSATDIEDPPPKRWKSMLRSYAVSIVPPQKKPPSRKRKIPKE